MEKGSERIRVKCLYIESSCPGLSGFRKSEDVADG